MAGVPADPWSSGLMAASSIAGGALNDKTAMTNGVNISNAFDSSGWNVNIGSGSQTSSAVKAAPVAANTLALLNNPIVLIGLAVVAYYYLSQK